MAKQPPADSDAKGPPKKAGPTAPKGIPGRDPKSEDWKQRGKANFVDKKTVSRPFKGGGRGR